MKWLIKLLLRNLPRPVLIRMSLFFGGFLSFFLRGNKVECPICKGKFRKFLSYGYQVSRSNVLCPKCLSLERHRLLWLFLNNETKFFTDQLGVLHVAPEQCFHKRFRKLSNINYKTADIESPLADIKLDIQEMNIPDNSYDVVICNHVLEHVDDDRKAMREIFRIIKPGGFAILQVPLDNKLKKTYEDPSITTPEERGKHFDQYDHVRKYGMDYFDRLRDAGFELLLSNEWKEEGVNERYRLPGEEVVPYALKSSSFKFQV